MGCSFSKSGVISPNDDSRQRKGNSSAEVTQYTPNPSKLNIVPEPSVYMSINDKDLKVDTIGHGAQVPPHPPKSRKLDIVPDTKIFKDIDEHALKAPSSLRSSVSELVCYLVQPAKNNLERVRSFYRWITDNIRYDTEGYFSDSVGSCDPHDVLKTGRSVCQGYADLFSAFCREVNIPVKTISGYAKGYSYNPEIAITPSTKTDHAWNVAFLNGDWRFVECTWGAGHLKEQRFTKEFTEFYFLTDPEDFISEHYPQMNKIEEPDSKWQLMKKPISLEDFCRRVHLRKTALEFGVIPVSHTTGVLEVQSDATFIIEDSRMNIESWMIDLSLCNGTNMNRYAMSYMQNSTALKIHVQPAAVDKYILEIFAKSRGKETSHHDLVLRYIIKFSDPAKLSKPYPSRQTPWAFCPEYRQYGFADEALTNPVFTAKNGELVINIPTTRNVEAIAKLKHAENRDDTSKYNTLIESSANKIVVRVRLPSEGFYSLDIMAKRPWEGGDSYWSSIAYLIDCRIPMIPWYPFPECYYTAIAKHNCHLLEPLNGLLKPKSTVKFRLESNILRRIIILDQNLSKTGNDIFDGKITIPDTGKITIYGSENESGYLDGLYTFSVAI
ncbi:hypothetical protein CHS0354_040419 [Potamilus streckersoni]|uniref:Transglutaminase-like domain-containing protein n=1 Tax=Potamilus streckersoni TaxID=2493646 RepID=A0AAE0T086_9BIVA|nr:hypothetical protein CHS0354_040419 [Potamilus streckersoni]